MLELISYLKFELSVIFVTIDWLVIDLKLSLRHFPNLLQTNPELWLVNCSTFWNFTDIFYPFKIGFEPNWVLSNSLLSHFFEINKNYFFRFLARGLKSTQPSFTKQADSTDKYRELPVLFFLKVCKFLSKNAQIAIEMINN